MDARDHVRRAVRHYLERDEDLSENPEDPARLNRSIRAAFTLARAAVAAARDIRDMALALPPAERGRPSPLHRHYEAVWSFLGCLWELIDFCEMEQDVAGPEVSDPVWFFGRALDQHLGGNPFEALAILEEGDLSEGGGDPWVQMLRAEALAASGDREEAIAAWEAATDLDPGLVPAHVSVAGELEAVGRLREALAHWLAVRKALPRDDPLAGEARRHIARLRQRLGRREAVRPAPGFERLPRWGPSWVPAWPGGGRRVADGEARPPEGVDGVEPRTDAPMGVLGLSGGRERELRVLVAADDPVSEGVVRSRMAVYLGGGRLVGVAGQSAGVEDEEPDIVVLASGVTAEFCASLAERARAGRLRSRAGPVQFLYNGPEDMLPDLRVIFDGLSFTSVPDIRPPAPEAEDEADAAEEEQAEPSRARDGLEATVAFIEERVKERRDGTPAVRGALARGAVGLAPVLKWLDSGERRHIGRRPPYDLVTLAAEPEAVEALAVRDGEVQGFTFGPEGSLRGRLLDELFDEVPHVLPPGDTALLVGRLLGEGAAGDELGDAEALVAAGVVSGVLQRAVFGLRQAVLAETLTGIRSSHLLVGGSLVSRLPSAEHALLAAVDGCQPVGITRVLLDPYGITAALGDGARTGRLRPGDSSWTDGTAALLAGSCLCVAPLVQAVKWGRPGRKLVLRVSVKGAWRDGERTWDLCRGELRWVPLPAGRRIELIVRPAPPYSVGRGRGVEWRGEFLAGGLGLLLDGRGRPLRLPDDRQARTTLRAAWASEVVGRSGPEAAYGTMSSTS
ncbi:MAG TPA: hypothetical protein DHW14_06505 [Clostridiales bacterium]|nr:hypothetical protein [Clostridiales bacterium]